MPRASLVAVIGGILAINAFAPAAGAASAVAAKPEAVAPASATDLVAANPAGSTTVVAVINYESAAGRMMGERLAAFARANPEIRIVVRPVAGGSPLSEFLAKAAYAAARQGRFQAFHEASLAAPIANTWYSLRDSAPLLGLDWQRFQQDFMDPKLIEEVRANGKFAEEHKLAAPGFVAGGQAFGASWDKMDLTPVAAAAKASR